MVLMILSYVHLFYKMVLLFRLSWTNILLCIQLVLGHVTFFPVPDTIGQQSTEVKKLRQAKIRNALMWEARKRKMLQVLEDAYPNTLHTPELLRSVSDSLGQWATWKFH